MILTLLSVLALVFFLAVTGLSHVFHAQQESLGSRWFTRGTIDLKQQRFQPAVSDFRTALLYSRDNYAYQLNLAEALIGLRRTSEAHAYLVNLWEREPENGLVNLELARIAVQNGETEQALRYYHNAIYATWPGDQEVERRDTRLELIEFLLGTNAKTQAQSELIALAANLADDPSQHTRVGELFLPGAGLRTCACRVQPEPEVRASKPGSIGGRWTGGLRTGPLRTGRAVSSGRGDQPIPVMRNSLTSSKTRHWYCAWILSGDRSRLPRETGLSSRILQQQVSGSSPVPLPAIRTGLSRLQARSRALPRIGRR